MPVLVFDRICSIADEKVKPQPISAAAATNRLPAPIAVLFSKAGVAVPSQGKIPLAQVDVALKGLNIEQRMRLKSQLAELKFID